MIFAARTPHRAPPTGARSDALLGRFAALAVFALVLVNAALISLSVAQVPVRGILAIALLASFAVLRPRLLRAAMVQHAMVLALAALLAVLGVISSMASGGQPAVIARAILEVHVQAVVVLLLATVAARLAGGATIITAFVAAIAVTALVALLQFAGFEPAWSLREILGNIQAHDLGEDTSFHNRRPMGLSYSPIHLTTQACLAFAAFVGLRYTQHRLGDAFDARIVLAVIALVAVSFAAATRSPILGALVFVTLFVLRQGRPWVLLFAATGLIELAIAAPAIIEAMAGAEYRALRVGDNSSTGRLPLFTFGMRLFLDNPLGYGFDFASQNHWARYWDELYTLPSAGVVREAELHNYLLNMLTTYGIGLLLALPLIAVLLWRGRGVLPAFVPYVVHLCFHNSGPFWNDALVWFVIGALSAVAPPAIARPGKYAPQLKLRPTGFRTRARA